MKYCQQFQSQLLTWFEENGRKNLPWQVENSYFVWVSEIMLQQTQVIKVIDYFANFIDKFPSIQVLAKADVSDVLQMWSGLGYYNRARNIHKTAVICHEDYHNALPLDLNELIALPGIGKTTAGAILSLSFNLPYPILDGNVKRVVSRVYEVKADKLSQLDKKLWKIVEQLIPQKNPKNHNQALMDLGSMICTRSKPKCNQCPLKNICLASKNNTIEFYPQKKAKTKQVPITLYALLSVVDNKVLLHQRNNKGIWAELWFLPLFSTESELSKMVDQHEHKTFEITHVLSHRILTIKVSVIYAEPDQKNPEDIWQDLSKIKNIPHPTALLKVLEFL